MIDFIKVRLYYFSLDTVLQNRWLEFYEQINLTTSEVKLPAVSKFGYFGFEIIVTEKYIEIRGSLHVLFNVLTGQGETNHDGFSLVKLAAVLRYLETKMHLDLTKCRLVNLEYAVNIELAQDVLPILKQNTIVQNSTSPTIRMDYEDEGFFLEWNRGGANPYRYLKNYDKGRHKGRKENIWRWEVKEMKSRYIQKLGVESLADLLNPDKLDNLKNSLLQNFRGMVIVDELAPLPEMTKREKEIYQKGLNPREWEMMPNKFARRRFKQSFLKVVDKYGLDTLKKSLTHSIESIWNQLQNRHENTDFEFVLKRNFGQKDEVVLSKDLVKVHTSKNGEVKVVIYPVSETKTATKTPTLENCYNSKTATKTHLSIVGNGSGFEKRCPISDIDISHQRKGSKYLSENTVLRMLEDGGKEVEKLKEKYLPKKRQSAPIKKQAYYIAHNIRNAESNSRHTKTRKVEKYRFSLFPVLDGEELSKTG